MRSYLHLVFTGNLYLDTEKHVNPGLNSQRGHHNHITNTARLEVVSLREPEVNNILIFCHWLNFIFFFKLWWEKSQGDPI